MTRTKSKSKKKTTHEQRFRKHIDTTVREISKRILYSGSSVTRGVLTEGFERAHRHVPGNYNQALVKQLATQRLRETPQDWYVTWAVFLETEADGQWYHQDQVQFERIKVTEFDVAFKQYLQQVVDDFRDAYGTECFKGYCWMAAHSGHAVVTRSFDHVVEQYVDQGVFDADKGNRIYLESKLERDLLGATNISADQAEHLVQQFTAYAQQQELSGT